MKKRNHFVKPFLVFVGILLVVNMLSFQFHGGLDLTSEKRFTVSAPTKKLVASVNEPLVLTVYLKGDMPTGFKRLAGAAEDLANAFKAESSGNFDIVFERPGEGLEDTAKAILFDSLQRMGINPTNVKAQLKKGEQTEETLLFPGAI